MTPLVALDAATELFGRHLSAVGADDWASPTSCPDWDVHYLVAHVVGGNRFATMVLNGMPSSAAIDSVMGRTQLADVPLRDYNETCNVQRAAFARPGAVGAIVSHPSGDLPGARFLGMRIFDITLHAWDLATALALDPAIAEELVEHVLSIMTTEPPGMGFGIEPLALDEHANALERLLGQSGRRNPPASTGVGIAGSGRR